MTARLDKHGQVVAIGDRVRLPSRRDGYVRGFGWSGGQERAIVQYHLSELDQVRLPACLLEKLHCRDCPSPRNPRPPNATVRRQGDHVKGENHYKARLSDKDVREMRELHRRAKKGYETLALIFGCGASTARDICTKRTRRDA
jgi:hypothetical protein